MAMCMPMATFLAIPWAHRSPRGGQVNPFSFEAAAARLQASCDAAAKLESLAHIQDEIFIKIVSDAPEFFETFLWADCSDLVEKSVCDTFSSAVVNCIELTAGYFQKMLKGEAVNATAAIDAITMNDDFLVGLVTILKCLFVFFYGFAPLGPV